jgi:uncharacterized protein with HEPN domain
MKKRRVIVDYLQDMLDNAEKARRFVQGVEFEAFRDDEEKVYAVVRALEVIGEAARHIPQSARAKYSQIPWRSVTGMRDKVIHDYFGVDLEVVWKTVHRDLPTLQETLANILAQDAEDKGDKA